MTPTFVKMSVSYVLVSTCIQILLDIRILVGRVMATVGFCCRFVFGVLSFFVYLFFFHRMFPSLPDSVMCACFAWCWHISLKHNIRLYMLTHALRICYSLSLISLNYIHCYSLSLLLSSVLQIHIHICLADPSNFDWSLA